MMSFVYLWKTNYPMHQSLDDGDNPNSLRLRRSPFYSGLELNDGTFFFFDKVMGLVVGPMCMPTYSKTMSRWFVRIVVFFYLFTYGFSPSKK